MLLKSTLPAAAGGFSGPLLLFKLFDSTSICSFKSNVAVVLSLGLEVVAGSCVDNFLHQIYQCTDL